MCVRPRVCPHFADSNNRAIDFFPNRGPPSDQIQAKPCGRSMWVQRAALGAHRPGTRGTGRMHLLQCIMHSNGKRRGGKAEQQPTQQPSRRRTSNALSETPLPSCCGHYTVCLCCGCATIHRLTPCAYHTPTGTPRHHRTSIDRPSQPLIQPPSYPRNIWKSCSAPCGWAAGCGPRLGSVVAAAAAWGKATMMRVRVRVRAVVCVWSCAAIDRPIGSGRTLASGPRPHSLASPSNYTATQSTHIKPCRSDHLHPPAAPPNRLARARLRQRPHRHKKRRAIGGRERVSRARAGRAGRGLHGFGGRNGPATGPLGDGACVRGCHVVLEWPNGGWWGITVCIRLMVMVFIRPIDPSTQNTIIPPR